MKIESLKKSLQQLKNQDLTRVGLALRITTATIIAILILKIINIPQGMFLILTTPVLMIVDPLEIKSIQIKSLIFSSLLTCFGVFSVTWYGHSLIMLLLMTAIFIAITGYAMRYGPIYHTAGILALIMILSAGGIPAQQDQAIWRALSCAVGCLIAIVFNLIFIQQNNIKQLKKTEYLFLTKLKYYFCYVTSDFLRGNYALNRALKLKEELIKDLQKIRMYETRSNFKNPGETSNCAGEFFTEIFQCVCSLVTILANPINKLSLMNITSKMEIFRDVSLDCFDIILRVYVEGVEINAKKNKALQEKILTRFNQELDKIYYEIQTLMVDMLKQDVIYNWHLI